MDSRHREEILTMGQSLRHAILGVGGVGGLIGASLARSGDSVTLIVRPESLAGYPRQLHLESPFGNVDENVSRAAEVPPVDVLWLSVKATQLDSALAAVTHPDTIKAIVPLLNGIDHVALLRKKYGAGPVIPATIAVESERVAPGKIVHRSPFARLNVLSAGKNRLGSSIEQLSRIGFECCFIDDEPTLMWSKLVFLAPFALSTTAADKTVGEILSDPVLRELGFSCVCETSAIAQAEGAKKIDPEFVIAGVSKMPGSMQSSMQKDVARGNPPELDAIAGPILRGAVKHGINVPATRKLVAEVERRTGQSPGLPA
jgi:2-dehydropantoate 2-reductase